jgi:hypothetical protein
LIIAVVTLILLRHFADRQRTPVICLVMTYVGWILGFSMVFLIPLDIYTTIINGDTADPTLIWIWYVYYWGSFVLNWTVFPFTTHYLEAGEFTKAGKSWYSIKMNAPWYALWGLIFAGLCCFLYFTQAGEQTLVEGGGLVGVIMGLTLVAGLIWLSLSLGYGIVKIPIRFWQYSSLNQRLNYF